MKNLSSQLLLFVCSEATRGYLPIDRGHALPWFRATVMLASGIKVAKATSGILIKKRSALEVLKCGCVLSWFISVTLHMFLIPVDRRLKCSTPPCVEQLCNSSTESPHCYSKSHARETGRCWKDCVSYLEKSNVYHSKKKKTHIKATQMSLERWLIPFN